MFFSRFAIPFALVVVVLLAFLAPRDAAPAPTIPARELLSLAQRAGGARYTFDRTTAAALATVQVPRPPAGAGQATCESALHAAGFALRPVGTQGKDVLLVEQMGG